VPTRKLPILAGGSMQCSRARHKQGFLARFFRNSAVMQQMKIGKQGSAQAAAVPSGVSISDAADIQPPGGQCSGAYRDHDPIVQADPGYSGPYEKVSRRSGEHDPGCGDPIDIAKPRRQSEEAGIPYVYKARNANRARHAFRDEAKVGVQHEFGDIQYASGTQGPAQ
jgi:hypothetical protein